MNNWNWRALWFYGAILVCLLLIVATVVDNRDFNLRREGNYAAMWSGLLLLLVALHAFDGREATKADDPAVARAWLVISMVLVSLSLDEIGSLHERLPSETHLMYWLWVLPFAATYAGLALYALVVLYRSEQYRKAALLICLAFLLFGSVAIQEEIEWRMNVARHWKPIRGAIEEGTELLGMIILLKATMANTKGLLSRDGRSVFPTLEALRAWRVPVLAIGLVGAPLIAWATVSIPPDRWNHGQPAHWPPTAVFLLAALCALRPFLAGSGGMRWTGWALGLVCLAGCTNMTLKIDSVRVPALMGLLVVAAIVLWVIDSRYAPRLYVPAAFALIAGVGIVWFASGGAFMRYWLVLWVALGVYYVNSTPANFQPSVPSSSEA